MEGQLKIDLAFVGLIDQFIRDKTNKRKDQYGGSIENRPRFCWFNRPIYS